MLSVCRKLNVEIPLLSDLPELPSKWLTGQTQPSLWPTRPWRELVRKIFSSGTIKPRLVYHIFSALKNCGMDIRCNPVSDKMPVSDIVSRNIWIILLTLVDMYLPCYIIQPVLTLASLLACLWPVFLKNKIQTELCSVCLIVLSQHKTNEWKSHSPL